MGGEHAALRRGILLHRGVEQVQGVHRIVAKDFSIVADLNRKQLCGRLASMVV